MQHVLGCIVMLTMVPLTRATPRDLSYSCGGHRAFGIVIARRSRSRPPLPPNTLLSLKVSNKLSTLAISLPSLVCLDLSEPINIRSDSKSAYDDAVKLVATGRLKHLDYRYHAVRTEISRGRATVQQMHGVDNAADTFTKPLPRPVFQRTGHLLHLEP